MSAALESRTPNPTIIAGRYQVMARLAQGGMGEVFHVRELTSGRNVALKRLLSPAERARALFQSEYHALVRLRHPYIVEVYDYGLDGDVPYYTMELLGGKDLRECARPGLHDACLHLRDVATSLALLHAQRLIHRDISPRNVRKTESGRCKLFDFGTMVPFGIPPNVAGTSPFISPEAWDGAQLDQRADLYSLGALGYWLLSGQLHATPRPLERRRAERVVPTRLARIMPEVTAELDDLIMALLEPDPSKRPWSAHDVIAQLSIIGGLENDDSATLAHSHLGSSRMVGKRRELSQAKQAMKKAQQYEGSALLVEAPPGVGKSRFLQEVSWLAQTQAFCVIRGFGAHGGRKLGVTTQLYEQLKRAVPQAEQRLSDSERRCLTVLEDERVSAANEGNDARAQLQWALTAYVRAATRETALLVMVDDLDAADEFSSAFVTSLAHIAHTRPLLVIASRVPAYASEPAVDPFAAVARRIALGPLNASETRTLIGDVLGRPASYARYAEWAYREAHGNPSATLALTAWLLERGTITYVNGGFVLPEGELHVDVAVDTGSPAMLQLQSLPRTALSLLEVLALSRNGAQLALCLAATKMDPSEVLSALDELVRSGVLVGAAHAYVFAQASLRSSICEALTPARAREVHLLLADAHLQGEDQSLGARLEAGYHLLHTERAREGALLLAEVCPAVIDAGIDTGLALDALERALIELERHPHTLTHRLRIRTVLARSSYLYDYRLAFRHEARTTEELTRWNGLWYLRPLLPYVGSLVVALLCLCFVALKRMFRPAADRGPGPYESMQLMARALVSYLGVHALATDGPGGMVPLSYLAALRAVPPPSSGRCVYLTSSALALQGFGREVELERAISVALAVLDANRLIDMTESEQRDMRVGLMLSRSINECYRIGSRALAMADELEAEGVPLARAASYRVRYAYYISRGMTDKAERYRRKLEVHGIQGGTTWQLEWFATPLTGMASVRFGNLVASTAAVERMERLSQEVSSLKPLLELMRIGQHVSKGEFAAAIARGERWVRAQPPRSVIGWGSGYAIYALALNHVGRHEDARAVCEQALSHLNDEDLAYVIMYGPLQRELSAALAGLGDNAGAIGVYDRFDATLEAAGEHALLAHSQEERGALARRIQDHPMLARSLIRMREAAERSGSDAVIHTAARLARLTSRATDDLLALALPTTEHPSAPTTDSDGRSAQNADRAATPRKGIAVSKRRSLLRRVMDHARASSALLYARPEPGVTPHLLASAGEQPPIELGEEEANALWNEIYATPVEAPLMAPRSLPHPELAGNFSVVPIHAPGERLPIALLLLVTDRTTPVDVPPTTWLSELAQRAQTARSESVERHSERLTSSSMERADDD